MGESSLVAPAVVRRDLSSPSLSSVRKPGEGNFTWRDWGREGRGEGGREGGRERGREGGRKGGREEGGITTNTCTEIQKPSAQPRNLHVASSMVLVYSPPGYRALGAV